MNEVDANGATPLYFAAQEGHTESVGWLLANANADPTHPTFDGMCALHAAAQTGHVAAFAIMLRFVHKR